MNFKILHGFPPPDLESVWRDGLTRVELPSHYVAPEYFLEPFWAGKRLFAVLALANDQVRGVLTGVHNGRHVISGLQARPQICADATHDAATTLETLLQGLLTEAASAELISVYTWPSLAIPTFSAHGFRSRELRGNVVLDLTRGAEALFREFPKDRRRNIRFAEKNGVVVHEAVTDQDIADAYEVYSRWFETKRKKINAVKLSFDTYQKTHRLTANHRLFLARLSGKVIAVNVFRFFPGGLFESAANMSLDEFIHLKPNDLLQWKGIEWACSHGFRSHNLGGAHPFLMRFGGTVVPTYHHRLDRTWLRRHDLRDGAREVGVRVVRKFPPFVEAAIRKVAWKDR